MNLENCVNKCKSLILLMVLLMVLVTSYSWSATLTLVNPSKSIEISSGYVDCWRGTMRNSIPFTRLAYQYPITVTLPTSTGPCERITIRYLFQNNTTATCEVTPFLENSMQVLKQYGCGIH